MKWADVYAGLGDPGRWDWDAITSASKRLNQSIRKLAVDKLGSHPVLPSAAELISRNGMTFEYGTGIHAEPSVGTGRDRRDAPSCRGVRGAPWRDVERAASIPISTAPLDRPSARRRSRSRCRRDRGRSPCVRRWSTSHARLGRDRDRRGLEPLTAQRADLEMYLRWMQEARRFKPSTVSRRTSVLAGSTSATSR
jgi:hypothetical protein